MAIFPAAAVVSAAEEDGAVGDQEAVEICGEIFPGDTADPFFVDAADPITDENEIVIDVNSGAPRSADFVSVNEKLETESGQYDLIMYGLKEENKDAVVDTLEAHYDPAGDDVLKVVDNAFADAEKYDCEPEDMWNTYDSNQCWAASAANMLWMSGWAEEVINPMTNAPFASEDEVFVFFNENFTDSGAEVSAGINWFFTGEFYNPGYSSARARLLQPKDPEDGLMKEFASMQVQERFDLIENPGDIARLADCDWSSESPAVFQASIGGLFEGMVKSSEHSVTVAGIIVDTLEEKLQDMFRSILIINSDNDAVPSEAAAAIKDPTREQKNSDKAARPNSVSVYNLAYILDAAGTPCWQLLGYDSYEPQIIYAINRLPLYSRELKEQYTETEGTKDLVENVDLKFGTVFTTGETERIPDLYGKDEKNLTKIVFRQGEPVNVNYFVANMSSNILNETYTDGRPLTVDWKVVRDADQEVVARGSDGCQLPIYFGMELGFMSYLNAGDGELQAWKPGNYTLYLDLNADRNVVEAYYLNNVQRTLSFTIEGEEEQEDSIPDEPEVPGDGKPDDPGVPGDGDPDEPGVPGDGDPDDPDVPRNSEPDDPDVPENSVPEEPDASGNNAPEKPDTSEGSDPEGTEEHAVPVQTSTKNVSSPKTGDDGLPVIWLITAFSAALAGCFLMIQKPRSFIHIKNQDTFE